ncbi:MAG TPA: phosphohydrolase [Lachnospiraceae bacterium]|nr:phosphohydrolase [Lachnospiraceae bacterium]HPF30346.1 phosphohydrolase [Lachnospiraceae bacterium]
MSNYMKTYTGRKVNPLEPKANDICLDDIAHALSLICRGNGQTTHFYSVAMHCINCQKEAKARNYSIRVQLGCLLHDASEAYLSDVIRPVKQHLPKYSEIEEMFFGAVFEHFNLSDFSEEEWDLVKEVDDALLDYDLTELLQEPVPEGGFRFQRTPDVQVVPFEQTEQEYKQIAKDLTEQLADRER